MPHLNLTSPPDVYQSLPWKRRSTALPTAPALTWSNGTPVFVRKMLLRMWTLTDGCLPSTRTAIGAVGAGLRETVFW